MILMESRSHLCHYGFSQVEGYLVRTGLVISHFNLRRHWRTHLLVIWPGSTLPFYIDCKNCRRTPRWPIAAGDRFGATTTSLTACANCYQSIWTTLVDWRFSKHSLASCPTTEWAAVAFWSGTKDFSSVWLESSTFNSDGTGSRCWYLRTDYHLWPRDRAMASQRCTCFGIGCKNRRCQSC